MLTHQPQINRNLFIAVASKGSVWLWRGSPETFIRPYLDLPIPTPASTPRPLSGPYVPFPSTSPLRLKFPQINSRLPLLHRIYNKLPPGRTHGGNLMGSYDRHISRSSTQNYLPRQRSGRGLRRCRGVGCGGRMVGLRIAQVEKSGESGGPGEFG